MSERRARAVAMEALARIEDDGAYANLVLPDLLGRADLERRDRAFVTGLVYGVTRMRRALDFLVDRYLVRDVEPAVRRALRIGAYQLHYLQTPAHAAVDTSVGIAPPRARGLVNAVLRRVAASPHDVEWPDDATRLSYPDWIVATMRDDLGRERADGALAQMNEPASETIRDDGYRQDRASQWVAGFVADGIAPGARVADLCAAPGGKATAIAAAGASVFASDVRESRSALVRRNASQIGAEQVHVLVADATAPAYRRASMDRVLVDAPCSGLGALRRRPDARWRIQRESVAGLAALQLRMVVAASALLRPGAVLVYSVCTLTAAESTHVDERFRSAVPEIEPLPVPPPPWEPWGSGALLLPQAEGTDGMTLFAYRRRP